MPTRKSKTDTKAEFEMQHADSEPEALKTDKKPVLRGKKGAASSAPEVELDVVPPLAGTHASSTVGAAAASFDQFVQTVYSDATAVESAIVTAASEIATIATNVAEAVSEVENIVHGGVLTGPAHSTPDQSAVQENLAPQIVVTPSEPVTEAKSDVSETFPSTDTPEMPESLATQTGHDDNADSSLQVPPEVIAESQVAYAPHARTSESLAELAAFANTLSTIHCDMAAWHNLLVTKTDELQTESVAFDQFGDECNLIEERVAQIQVLHEHIVRDSEAYLELRDRRAAALARVNSERLAELVQAATDRWLVCRHRMEALFDSL